MKPSTTLQIGMKKPSKIMSTKSIALNYREWIISPPFDIGYTTKAGLNPLIQDLDPSVAKSAAYENNQKSLSNGSLMRITPLIVWGSTLDDPFEFYKAIKADVEFTHPNRLVHDAIFLYGIAIQYLLNNPADPSRSQNAFGKALRLSDSIANHSTKENVKCKDWLILSQNMYKKAEDLPSYSVNASQEDK